MKINRRRNLLVVLAASLVLACSCPLLAQATQPSPPIAPAPTSTPSSLETATAASPAATGSPTPSPTATLSPTPSVPEVRPISANVNCRSGPLIGYAAVGALMLGQTAQIAGRNEDSSWWYIHDPGDPGGFCWVAANVVTTSGNLAGIPYTAPQFAIVTDVSVDVSAPSTIYCGGPNALEFSGTITTNGSAKVKFRWEVKGDKTNTTPNDTLNFADAGTKDAPNPGAYDVDCGSYSITLHVLSPNDISATKKFKIKP